MTSKLPEYLQAILEDIPYVVEQEIFAVLHPIKHMIPMDDYKPHDLHCDCWCKPSLDDDVCYHNLMVQSPSNSIH